MIGKETTLEYLLLHILPVAISGFVAIFCFWLGVFREKHKEKEKGLLPIEWVKMRGKSRRSQ